MSIDHRFREFGILKLIMIKQDRGVMYEKLIVVTFHFQYFWKLEKSIYKSELKQGK